VEKEIFGRNTGVKIHDISVKSGETIRRDLWWKTRYLREILGPISMLYRYKPFN